MAQCKFAVLAVLAAAGVTASSTTDAQILSPPAQAYPSQQSYPGSEPSPYRGPNARVPNFDALDDDDRSQGSVAMQAPGPVLSPDDPRYGRPMGPPPVIYSDRPAGPPPIYSDRGPPAGSAVQDAMLRPPAGVGGQDAAPGTTASTDPSRGATLAALPPEDQPEIGAPKELPAHLKRQEVYYETKEPAGTIVVDTANTHLYFVLGGNRAIRYGVRVGREGFTWSGVQKITRKAEWPDWHPPPEMIERQPYLPRFMAGGDGNPLGARALYLGSTIYRIHGTNQPSTIGKFVSSGCVGMLNEDVTDLFERVKVGTRVVVLPGKPPPPAVASAQNPTNLTPPGGQQSYPPTSYVPPPGAQPAAGQPQVYRGDARTDATAVQPLPPATTIR